MEVAQIRSSQTFDGFGVSMARPMKGVRAVNKLAERPARDNLRPILRAVDFGKRSRTLLRHIIFGKYRVHQQIRDQLEAEINILLEYGRGDDDALERPICIDSSSGRFDRLGNLQ